LTDSRPLISAIVSTYNSEEFIAGCLNDLLSQSIAERLEIVVVDSGSEQKEGDIVKDYQRSWPNIKYIRTEQRETVYKAWNRGIMASTGRYITNANTDDRHRHDAFEVMARALDNMPHIALVYGDVALTYNKTDSLESLKGKQIPILRWDDWDRLLLLQKCFIGPQPMWRREVHDLYGYFKDSLVSSGDYEFWLRISQTFDFYHIPEVLGLYLSRSDSVEKANPNREREDNLIKSMYLKAALSGRIIRCPAIRQFVKAIKVSKDKGFIQSRLYSLMYEALGKSDKGLASILDMDEAHLELFLHNKLLEGTSWYQMFLKQKSQSKIG